ncbi:lysozyme inhibitor LprI family protein [Tissierella praeacuta]|uniref:lysozyme inhibitor LprI family protein n=1 Tax=Tissierella praeacuta TaxID=43131 RepID=UPI0028AA7686|nr:lysozyme inhibitor LprI family protein [Tissierella praeacuta]
MKNYYGMAYEMYDKELNEIYALLKDELSPEIMEDLKTKQIKWIKEKEEQQM